MPQNAKKGEIAAASQVRGRADPSVIYMNSREVGRKAQVATLGL